MVGLDQQRFSSIISVAALAEAVSAAAALRVADFMAVTLAQAGFHGNFAHVNDVNVAHVGGTYWHAPVYHGAWYGSGAVAAGAVAGAAIGAAAANPYYYPQCGYYPLPPCY